MKRSAASAAHPRAAPADAALSSAAAAAQAQPQGPLISPAYGPVGCAQNLSRNHSKHRGRGAAPARALRVQSKASMRDQSSPCSETVPGNRGTGAFRARAGVPWWLVTWTDETHDRTEPRVSKLLHTGGLGGCAGNVSYQFWCES